MNNTEDQNIGQSNSGINTDPLINILRILCMLEGVLNRAVRRNYRNRSQYPAIFFEIESGLNALRSWIRDYKYFQKVPTFIGLLSLSVERLGELIGHLIAINRPAKGMKGVKKESLLEEQRRVKEKIERMLDGIGKYLEESESCETEMGIELEKFVFELFERHWSQKHTREPGVTVSRRGNKTCVFPWSDKRSYLDLIRDTRRFRKEVADKLGDYIHTASHKPTCKCSGKYVLKGFRPTPRKPVTEGGRQEEFPIRMVECADCGQKFSVIPSFLPREKHFSIDIIGNIVRGIVLSGHSLQDALEDFKLTGAGLKSKQTILNWIRWMGTHHPATLLTRAGVKGSGYLQEDEGFEKEPDLRTYTVVMVEPETFLVWHLDYVDHVDEETLTGSFGKFIERINFKILGVTKDKWEPATKALKEVCDCLWIGFCHRHCLKKFRKALSEYQKETMCNGKEIKRLYQKFKKVLDMAGSKTSMEIQLRLLRDEAFNHPLLKKILNEVKKNAVHYTSHKSRNGIKKTTSILDNFMKIIKRKLRQVQSFRDPRWAGMLFRAMANVRNFMPFWSGAKNAHKSPFMLAGGQTYDLPWIQVMNVHNAFLFTKIAC
jgi:hypothetical protein